MVATKRVSRQRRYSLKELQPTGSCLECGEALIGKQRKYCNLHCQMLVWARYDYNTMRQRVLERDNYTCQICGVKSRKRMEVDHIIPLADGGPSLELSNCRTLCHTCHVNVTTQWRKLKQGSNQLKLEI